MNDASDMVRHVPFPFSDARFPPELGAVVQMTVLEGHEPARTVIHTDENDWLVGDGVNDPNLPDATVATHMWHVIEQNSSIADLARLPLGYMATRTGPGDPWSIAPHAWEEDE